MCQNFLSNSKGFDMIWMSNPQNIPATAPLWGKNNARWITLNMFVKRHFDFFPIFYLKTS